MSAAAPGWPWVGRMQKPPGGMPERGQGGAGGCDQVSIQLGFSFGLAAAVLDGERTLLGQPAVIAPDDRRRPSEGVASFSKRAITRTASHSRELSLGACISASVTVLSIRTIVPRSSFSCRALLTTARLIASQLAALMALIVLCNTDFFGDHAKGNRAKARNDAESSR